LNVSFQLPKVLLPAEAVEACRKRLRFMPEIFGKILIDYGSLSRGWRDVWQFDWTDDEVLKHYIRENIKKVSKIFLSENYMAFENPRSINIPCVGWDGA
jgi:hypothetical protein